MFLVTSVVAVAACGITAVGELVDAPNPSRDGGPDGPFLLPDGAPFGDGGGGDADPDVNPVVLCPTVCEAGTCDDAGTCVIECNDAAAPCADGGVTCPVGVPCAARCTIKDSCRLGIDCTKATRCDIACTGEDSCLAGVKCSGSTCDVACNGPGKACELGVSCEAGTCNIACAKDDCSGGPVACVADECNINCGLDAAADEKNACKKGISCNATKACAIDCFGTGSCQGGIDVRARDASILCGAVDSCEGIVTCADAGACAFNCAGAANTNAIKVCCPDAGCSGNSTVCTGASYVCQ